MTDGGLSVWLSLGLLHAELDDVVVDVDYSGNDFPNVPDWTASAGCIYAHSSGLFVEADVASRPETRAELDNNPLAVNDERTLVNARIGYTVRSTELSLYVRNLFDDEYHAWRFGAFAYVPGDPREVGMTVSVAL